MLGGALTISVLLNLRDESLFEPRNVVPMVAVLPFQDLSEVGAHITVGIAEELMHLLVREPNIRVMSSALSLNLAGNNAGDADTARDIALDLLKRLPHFEPAYNQLGQAYWQLGELDQAEQTFVTAAEVFAKAVELNPQNYRAQMFVAISLHPKVQFNC